jgi:transcriptional regulator GlxA family with amidase domain
VFSLANRIVIGGHATRHGETWDRRNRAPYDLEVVARQVDSLHGVQAASGLRVGVDRLVGAAHVDPDQRPVDTLLVAGGPGFEAAAQDRELLAWIAEVAPECRRVGSVCTGAFVLAETGLLDGRRAVTHWASCRLLQDRYPRVGVEDDPVFVRDGRIVTSAGVTAGIDLALALVEEDLGPDVALAVAQALVVFVQRPGGQSQFSAQLMAPPAEGSGWLKDLLVWVVDNPGAELTVAALARRAGVSSRHFARLFREETGTTPARYVETVRVEAARRRLERSDEPIGRVAREVGFGTVETMDRAFRRQLKTSPSDYRGRFTRQGSYA